MKKFILLFTFLFMVSSSFMSCRDNPEENNPLLEEETVDDLEVYEDEDEVTTVNFADYDADNDGLWNQDEYGEAFDNDWAEWDLDGDGYLDDNEFYSTTYALIDTNDDDRIDENEWNEGFNNFYGDYVAIEDFDEYDLNDDGFLDEDEWYEGWGDSEWYNDYDFDDDGLVSNDDWNEGLFGNWDEDGDGFWNEDEFNTYNVYYDTW